MKDKEILRKEFEDLCGQLNIQIERVEPGQGGLQVGDFFVPANQVFDYLFGNLKKTGVIENEFGNFTKRQNCSNERGSNS